MFNTGLYIPKNYDVEKYAIQKNLVGKFEPISESTDLFHHEKKGELK
jgi:hypothetical protein